MTKKRDFVTNKNWHEQPKYVKPTTEGKCKFCHKHVKALEQHMHDKHKGKKPIKK
ncbi:hypothetical protein HYS47_01115 [Candidatus Woesearchaeota archaeon]|nr:hypothetical protein [Candidatus Woesearchaeota archaeon]